MNNQMKPGDHMKAKAKAAVDAALNDARNQSLVLKVTAKPVSTAKD